jgi:hypothetical protein
VKQETRDVWVADDGKVFDSRAACEQHEAETLKRQQAMVALKVWNVTHGFDETEGRGYFAETIIITDADEAVLIQWCLDTFGAPLSGWYGDGFFAAWILRKTPGDVAAALKSKGTKRSGNWSPTKLAVVSQKDWTWAGLPKSEFPWPRKNRDDNARGAGL